MPKLTEYPEAQSFDENDILIKDGVNGTKKIKASNAADYMGKNVIMVNEDPTPGTKVVLETTDEEYELALMSDVNSVAEEVADVKTQLNLKLNLKLDKPTEETSVTYTATESARLSSDGTITNLTNPNTAYCVGQCSVTGGDLYYIEANANYGAALYAFYDSNGDVLTIKQSGTSGTERAYFADYVYAPSGAVTLRINYITTLGNGVVKSVDFVTVDIAGMQNTVDAITNDDNTGSENDVWTVEDGAGKWGKNPFNDYVDNFSSAYSSVTGTATDGKYINKDADLIDHVTPWGITAYAVNPGEQFLISGSAYKNAYLYAFYNSDSTFGSGTFISGLQSTESGTTIFTNQTATVPADAVTMIVGYTDPRYLSVFKLSGNFVNNLKSWSDKKWTCVGDSLTAVNARTTKHYFDYVAETTGIMPYNMGVSGSGYADDAGSNSAFWRRISNVPLDSDVITIFGSFNDLSTDLPLGTMTDSTTETIAGCVNVTLDNLFTAFPLAIVGLVSPTPWQNKNRMGTDAEHTNAIAYVELLKSICERRSIPFLDLFDESLLRPWDATFRTLAYSKDDGGGTHPDETGHAIIAPRFEAFLETLLLR